MYAYLMCLLLIATSTNGNKPNCTDEDSVLLTQFVKLAEEFGKFEQQNNAILQNQLDMKEQIKMCQTGTNCSGIQIYRLT